MHAAAVSKTARLNVFDIDSGQFALQAVFPATHCAWTKTARPVFSFMDGRQVAILVAVRALHCVDQNRAAVYRYHQIDRAEIILRVHRAREFQLCACVTGAVNRTFQYF